MSEWLQNISPLSSAAWLIPGYYWFWPETQKQEEIKDDKREPVEPKIITRETIGYPMNFEKRMSYADVCMSKKKIKF